MGKAAKIVKEIQTKTCIDGVDAEVIEKILQDELNEYCRMLEGYYAEEYAEEYSNAITSAQHRAYDEGHSDGYADGYDIGYDDGRSESHS